MKLDYFIVGAGLTGATIAERLHKAGKRVLVIDRRAHVAGNCFDELDEHGILVHRHGPHFFHTDSKDVWTYLSGFTKWLYRRYTHGVFVDGQVLDLPLNLQSLRAMLPSWRISDLVSANWLDVTLSELRDGKLVEQNVYMTSADEVYRPYSEKMWGRPLEDLDKSVLDRIPIRLTEATARYTAAFQGVPQEGYTRMVERMLEGVPLELGREVSASDEERIIWTGRIDQFFGFCFGALPYRTLDFEWEHHQVIDSYQEKAVVNYPRGHAFTRIVEHKRLTGQSAWGTTISFETPRESTMDDLDVHYPVPTQAAQALHEKYVEHALEAVPNVVFAGRLGSYRYLYMGEAVEAALNLADRLLKGGE